MYTVYTPLLSYAKRFCNNHPAMIYMYIDGVNKMKIFKTGLQNRLSNKSLAKLMCMTIEGPELMSVNFEAVLNIFFLSC